MDRQSPAVPLPRALPFASGPRAAVPGGREVVGAVLATRDGKAEARALLVGAQIDTRNLDGFVDPDVLVPDGIGAAFVFRYGVVVLFGADDQAERDLLDRVKGHVVDPLATPEVESAAIEIRAVRQERVAADGHIVLRQITPERLLLVATVLARSTVLAHDEDRIRGAFDRIEPIVSGLRTRGRVGLSIPRVMQNVGDVLAVQHRVIGRAEISEKPDLLWDHPELDRLYVRLEGEFELVDRARALERKLEVIGDATNVLLDVVRDKRSVRLELAIIGLIAFEIVLTLSEMF